MNEVLLWTNGYPVPGSYKDVFFEVLKCIDVQWASIEVIKENITVVIEITKEYCILKKEELKKMMDKKEKRRLGAGYTRFCGYLDKVKEMLDKNHSLERIQKWYYECLMSLKGMGPLRGYSTGTKFGDDLHIDPERDSMMSKPRGRL